MSLNCFTYKNDSLWHEFDENNLPQEYKQIVFIVSLSWGEYKIYTGHYSLNGGLRTDAKVDMENAFIHAWAYLHDEADLDVFCEELNEYLNEAIEQYIVNFNKKIECLTKRISNGNN